MGTKNLKKNWNRFGNKEDSNKYECFYCGERLSDFNRTVDHIVPKSKGGILSNDNKVYSCKRCNQFKADVDVETFLGMTRFLIKELDYAHDEKMAYYHRLVSRLVGMVKSSNGKGKENTKHTT